MEINIAVKCAECGKDITYECDCDSDKNGITINTGLCPDCKAEYESKIAELEEQVTTSKTSVDTFLCCINNPFRNVYLVEGDKVGIGSDGEPLIKNVKIIKLLRQRRETEAEIIAKQQKEIEELKERLKQYE